MMKLPITILTCAILAAAPACSTLSRVAASAAQAAAEYGPLLDAIDAAAEVYFARHPDADRAGYELAMSRTRLALSAAVHAARGAGEPDPEAAFEEFRIAYAKVLEIVGPLGIATPALDGTVAAAPDQPLVVPAPEALAP